MGKYRVSTKENEIIISRSSGIKPIEIDEKECYVFERNYLSGFFQIEMTGRHRVLYTAPSAISLQEYMNKNFTVHKFYHIVVQVAEIVKKVHEYGLTFSRLVLNTQLIYIKEITGEVFFLYEPVCDVNNHTSLSAFYLDYLKEIKTEDARLQREIVAFRTFIGDRSHHAPDEVETYVKRRYPQIYQQISVEENRPMEKFPEAEDRFEDCETTVLGDSEEETTILSCEEETMVLAPKFIVGTLTRQKNNEVITIDHDGFTIGKSMHNDYMLTENKAISRKHATFLYDNGVISVMDMGSTNGTFVNDKQIEQNEITALTSGDVIMLADEEFIFEQ